VLKTRTRGAKAPLSSRLPMPGGGTPVSGLEAEVEAEAVGTDPARAGSASNNPNPRSHWEGYRG